MSVLGQDETLGMSPSMSAVVTTADIGGKDEGGRAFSIEVANRGFMERLIFDQLEAAIDPNAAQSFRRIEQGARRDYGQRFFWKPGATAPARGPDLGAAVR
jgi:hypothetical protein